MDVKSAIAREWLFILGFAIISFLAGWITAILMYPKSVPYPGAEPEGYKLRYDLRLIRLEKALEVDSPTHAQLRELDSLRQARFDITDSRERWAQDQALYRRYLADRERAERISLIALVMPYPLFLFIRSVMWSINQVRRSKRKSI